MHRETCQVLEPVVDWDTVSMKEIVFFVRFIFVFMVFEFSRLTQGQSQLLRFSVDSIVFKLLTSSLQFLIAWFVIIAEVTQTVFQICRRILVTNLQDGTILCVLSVHSFH